MALKAKVLGREALNAKLSKIAPNVEKYAVDAKLMAADELAEAIRARAPRGATLEYAESIEGDLLKDRPQQERIGVSKTKDPSAVGVFAQFIWNWLEFGTAPHGSHPGTPAQPHVFPTYRAMKPAIKKKIRAAVNRAVREAMRK
ncbi:HK97 gp10 family phage protein [Rhizobium rhizogenes]|uniref:Phage-related protein n=1 Tax=Rhizobium rhizogenes (strain K84 / ATCC BAA-868) TaxID=311403 RepID=B9JF34_RHIR8|nr:phage-related protein [Rhizobium rhizogenes K84]